MLKNIGRLTILVFAWAMAGEAGAQTTASPPSTFSSQAGGSIDYKNAKPMPLPAANPMVAPPPQAAPAARSQIFGPPGSSPGAPGTGKLSAVQLAPAVNLEKPQVQSQAQAQPEEFGTGLQPYTTSEVNAVSNTTTNFYPFRAAGKLFFNINGSSFVCSASLIKRGIVVTAGHCVANFGQRQFYSGWQFVPAYNNGSAPFGVWAVTRARVMTSYYNGSDPCFQSGVICQDDMALLELTPQSGALPGSSTGWFGYGWNGYSSNSSTQVLINQLGYPVALDSGALMERNDSQGFTNTSFSNNRIIGSLMTGGSSGGPWLVNLGTAPSLVGTAFGTGATHNLVVNVTSWGYTATTVKQQGASPFTSSNIVPLVAAACAASPANCL